MKNKCCGGKCQKQKEAASDEVIGFLIIALVLLGSVAATLSLIF